MATRSIPVNDNSIAALLDIGDVQPLIVVLGRPGKNIKSMKIKKFAKRVQRSK